MVRNKLHWDATQLDFQNKRTLTSPARLSFVFKVPLRYLRPSVIYSVPCDRILQKGLLLRLGGSNTNKTMAGLLHVHRLKAHIPSHNPSNTFTLKRLV